MKADMVLLNGKVYSVSSDNRRITGQAVAIKDGLIMKVGSDEEIKPYVIDTTEVIDCHGKTILPGLCDAHCHPAIAASVMSACDLFGIYRQKEETSEEILEQYLKRLRQYVKTHPDKKLIRGAGWVFGNFPKSKLPTRQDIDRICSDRPVILESFCQHNLWVNTKAIELAGVDEHTPNVHTGEICREEDGKPSGVFCEPEAMNLIKENVPGYDFSVSEYKDAFLYYQKECANRYGVTLLQDCMHSDNARKAYVELAKEKRLTVRLRGTYLLEPAKREKQFLGFTARKGSDNVDDLFRIDTIKVFSEGEFSLLEPYEEDYLQERQLSQDYNGALFWKDEALTDSAEQAIRAGFQIHIHAMGDKAVKQSVRCLSMAQRRAGRQTRNVIAHLMLVEKEDAENMSYSGIIANCQPRWMVYDSDIAAMIPMMGKERAERAYPFRKLADAGIIVSFGTDFPVTPPPDTMHEIQCAMTRSVFPEAADYEKFKGAILGSEKTASLQEAIKALSINGAYQMFAEEITGSIEEGKSAELVILDKDLEDLSVNEIYKTQVQKTIFKGKVVYEKKDV